MRESKAPSQPSQPQTSRPKSAPLVNGEEEAPTRPQHVTVSSLQQVEDRKRVQKKNVADDPVAVTLQKGEKGFGFSIRGGDSQPLYVLRIAENGAAAIDGRIKVSGGGPGVYLVILFVHKLRGKIKLFEKLGVTCWVMRELP